MADHSSGIAIALNVERETLEFVQKKLRDAGIKKAGFVPPAGLELIDCKMIAGKIYLEVK